MTELNGGRFHRTFMGVFWRKGAGWGWGWGHALSCQTLCDSMDCSPPSSSVHGILQARIMEWLAHSLLQGIVPTQGSNLGLLHCRQALYHLSHQGSPVPRFTRGQIRPYSICYKCVDKKTNSIWKKF